MRLFDWDPRKNVVNRRKHGVSFEDAMDAMTDPRAMIEIDDEHSENEFRERLLGLSMKGVLLVVYVVREHHEGEIYRNYLRAQSDRKGESLL